VTQHLGHSDARLTLHVYARGIDSDARDRPRAQASSWLLRIDASPLQGLSVGGHRWG